jgi:hypothetical protein
MSSSRQAEGGRVVNYELKVRGTAGPTICAVFSDCDVVADVAHDSTTIRAEVADPAALHGLIDRVRDLGIEILEVRQTRDSPD